MSTSTVVSFLKAWASVTQLLTVMLSTVNGAGMSPSVKPSATRYAGIWRFRMCVTGLCVARSYERRMSPM